MQQRVESILRNINSNKRYNILTFPTHERTQANWGKLPHTFYLFQGKGIKTWNNDYAPLPPNHILLDGSKEQIKHNMKFDIVLEQNRGAQFDIANKIASYFNVPLITYMHILPYFTWTKKMVDQYGSMRGKVNIFISEYSVNKWGYSLNDPSVRVLHHGVDASIFCPDESVEKKDYSFSCCNDLPNRDWCCGYKIWQEVSSQVPNKLVGDNKGISKPAVSVEDLVNEYRMAKVFFNHSLISPIPTVVLEAMACGLPVVSTDNCMLPEVIEHNKNGFLTNDPKEMVKYINLLLKDDEMRNSFGRAARETIIRKFSLDKHLQTLNNIFDEVAGTTYET